MDVVFTPSARAQFLAAVQRIHGNNRAAARKFRQQAGHALERLSRFPNSGTVVTEFPDLPDRELFIKPYRFFDRVRDETVWVVAVWHSARLPEEPQNG